MHKILYLKNADELVNAMPLLNFIDLFAGAGIDVCLKVIGQVFSIK